MVHRRSVLLSTVAVFALLFTGAAGAIAQEGMPTSVMFPEPPALPELHVRVTDSAYEGLPAETPAGRYLLTVEITATDGGGVDFLQLPEGMTLDDFMTLLAGPSADGMSTPGAGGEAAAPEWYYQTRIAGGAGGGPGQTVQAIIDLTPGNWIAWADDPSAPQTPVGLTVTEAGATPGAEMEPAVSVTISTFEYGFKVDGAFATGPQAIKITNVGAQPHFVFMGLSPTPVTKEQVKQLLELDMMGATPAPDSGLPSPDEIMPGLLASTISMGVTEWVAADLVPGTYVLLCFVPDIASGLPHAFEGMYDVITIGEATPTT
jgi:hypothetical protein